MALSKSMAVVLSAALWLNASIFVAGIPMKRPFSAFKDNTLPEQSDIMPTKRYATDPSDVPELPEGVLAEIMAHLPSVRDQATMALVDKQMAGWFDVKISPAIFVEKFGIRSLDMLDKYMPDNDAFRAGVFKEIVRQLPRGYQSQLINLAASKKDWSTVELMLKFGADPQLLTYSINRATAHGWQEDLDEIRHKVKLFSKRSIKYKPPQVDMNKLDALLQQTLHQTPFMHDEDVIKELEKNNVWLPLRGDMSVDSLDKLLVVVVAAYGANNDLITAAVNLLLSYGADVHADSCNALRCAAAFGCLDAVRVLLDSGADAHADNDMALRYAARNNHWEVVKLLRDRGAFLDAD